MPEHFAKVLKRHQRGGLRYHLGRDLADRLMTAAALCGRRGPVVGAWILNYWQTWEEAKRWLSN